jgi:prevent-host-death family protein
MGKIIGAAEFKAHCLRILDEVERTGEGVTVTKHGRPVAELKPVTKKEPAKLLFGTMKGTVFQYERPFDPAIDPDEWEASR